MNQTLEKSILDAIAVLKNTDFDVIPIMAEHLAATFALGGKALICGCGGSAADAQHLASELVGVGFPAVALTDAATITALGNDVGFSSVFSHQVSALGLPNDVLIAFTTSGQSTSIIKAIEAARNSLMSSFLFTGEGGIDLARAATLSLIVASNSTPRIQEAHGIAIHALCDLIVGDQK